MAVPLCKLQGTWEEIAGRIPNFRGQRLEVVVYPSSPEADDETVAGVDPILAVLRDIEERSRTMNPKPDDRDYLREARSGAMFGLDPLD